ncbi:MAG: putative DNA binding domain-containing protein [Anaerolineae bacterium]
MTDLEGSTRRRTTGSFFDGSKPQYPRRMHCIQGSDAHRIRGEGKNLGVGERATEVFLPEVSFAALKELFMGDDFARTRPYRRAAEPFDHIEAARAQGPTIVQSFHENMTRAGGCLHAIIRDVVAFANTNGGMIYVGVTANQRVKPKGVENPAQALKAMREEVSRMVTPPLDITLDTIQSGSVNIVRLTVPRGSEIPYAMEGSKIYIRKEAETSLAVRDEILALVRDVVVKDPRGSGSRPAAPQPKAQGSQPQAKSRQEPPAAQQKQAKAEPPAGAPASQEAAKPSGSRRRRSRKPAAESAASEQAGTDAVDETDIVLEVAPAAEREPGGDVPFSDAELAVEPPRTGVEIHETIVRQGTQYHTMRDLRDGNLVHNVTRTSARRLWRYAIALHEKGTFGEDKVQWKDSLGLWHKYLRSGKPHFDLVQKDRAGVCHVYYGVSEDGIHSEWRTLVGEHD